MSAVPSREDVMKSAALTAMAVIVIFTFGSCSSNGDGVGEIISKPEKPSGPDSVYAGEFTVFSTAGAVSNQGHQIEYRFDCDAEADHDYSEWNPSDSLLKEWSEAGTYIIKVQARCAQDKAEESPWSDGRAVMVMEPTISQPTAPTGPPSRKTEESGRYCTGGSVSDRGEAIEYRFDFDAAGAHDTTNWSRDTCMSHSWSVARTYLIKAQARSATDAALVSPWSDGSELTVKNHDPDTRILRGWCFFTPQSTGLPDSMLVDFGDNLPDTLPNRSRLRLEYEGWDNALAGQSPVPIRFQFAYRRWAIDDDGRTVAEKLSPWYPLRTPEDTNPKDLNPLTRDRDSTTMRVNMFNYQFFVRSFDEQNRADATPAAVTFYGDFSPTIDSVSVGFYDQVSHAFREVRNDTLLIGWSGSPGQSRGVVMNPYEVKPEGGGTVKSYKFVIRAAGHDDRREPPGSAIRAWKFTISDPDAEYQYAKEGEWLFDKPLNALEQEIILRIQAFADFDVNNPPEYLGAQVVRVFGRDNQIVESLEGIRGLTPQFDANGNPIPGNYWIWNSYILTLYERSTTLAFPLYLKLIM